MRPSQVARLKTEDFKLDAGTPHVIVPRAKGGKTAVVPLLEEGVAVRPHLHRRRSVRGVEDASRE